MPHAADETYIHLPASKEFYVFTTSVIEPNRASVVAYGNKRKRRRWGEQVKAAKAGSPLNAISVGIAVSWPLTGEEARAHSPGRFPSGPDP